MRKVRPPLIFVNGETYYPMSPAILKNGNAPFSSFGIDLYIEAAMNLLQAKQR
jgi:hypothetical protein